MDKTAELQQLLNISVAHVRKQGRPSGEVRANPNRLEGEMFYCLYRLPDGASCAAAPFITEYVPEMENQNFDRLVANHRECLDPRAVAHQDFVQALQTCHDTAAERTRTEPTRFMEQYEYELRARVVFWNGHKDTKLVVPEAA